jgi:hypothetical protein
MNTPWNPDAQIKAQLNAAQLAQLHAEIKARAEIPVPTYLKLFWSWPFWLFDVRILPDYVQHPIHYFELFGARKSRIHSLRILMPMCNIRKLDTKQRQKGNPSGGKL